MDFSRVIPLFSINEFIAFILMNYYSKLILTIYIDQLLSFKWVLRANKRINAQGIKPRIFRVDNGPEYTSKGLKQGGG